MNKERHILFVASWYPNRNQPVLGNFIQRHAQSASLYNRISVVSAFSTLADASCVPLQNGNLTEFITYYPQIQNGDQVLSKIRKVKAYRKAIREAISLAIDKNGYPDIIHVHVAWPAALAMVPIALEMNVPLVLTEHWSGYLPEDGNYKGYFLRRYTKKLFAASKVITVVSDKMKSAMVGHGLRGKFLQLPNTVDTSVFNFAANSNSPSTAEFQFLHVSMLVDREKNITGLLYGFSKACKNAQSHLTIVGDGPERRSHEATAKELGIASRVSFVGIKSSNEIADLMRASDALVMFSNFEGMPVTIIEAKCCGLPVIATNTGAISEMLDQNNDILLEPKAVVQLVEAMIEMTKRHSAISDHNKVRVDISNKAQARYSFQAIGEQLDAIYKEVEKK